MKKNINLRMNRTTFVDEGVIYTGAGGNLRKMLKIASTRRTCQFLYIGYFYHPAPTLRAGRCHCTDFIEDKTVISPFIHLSAQSPTHSNWKAHPECQLSRPRARRALGVTVKKKGVIRPHNREVMSRDSSSGVLPSWVLLTGRLSMWASDSAWVKLNEALVTLKSILNAFPEPVQAQSPLALAKLAESTAGIISCMPLKLPAISGLIWEPRASCWARPLVLLDQAALPITVRIQLLTARSTKGAWGEVGESEPHCPAQYFPLQLALLTRSGWLGRASTWVH